MAEKRISYIDRTYEDYRTSILQLTKNYYSDIFDQMNDASVGSWLVDIISDVSDTLSYNIDRAYQETSLDSANEFKSVLNIARSVGCKITGRKAALVEVELTCELPLNHQGDDSYGDITQADESYAPIIKRGTLFSTGLQTFELMSDVDFSKQFDENGVSNRQIYPTRDSNGTIVSYTYAKLAIAAAGRSKIYRKQITNSDVVPFMEVTLNDPEILEVESIILKNGTDLSNDPAYADFFVDAEEYTGYDGNLIQRYFEVDNLLEQYRFGDEVQKDKNGIYNPIWVPADVASYDTLVVIDPYYCVPRFIKWQNNDDLKREIADIIKPTDNNYDDDVWINSDNETKLAQIDSFVKEGYELYFVDRYDLNRYVEKDRYIELLNSEDGIDSYTEPTTEAVTRYVTRGMWKRFKNKFVTEFTDDWSLKIRFGKGIRNEYGEIPEDATDFTKYLMCRMEANDCFGVLPEPGKTMYILYRTGGGLSSNIARDTLTNITYINATVEGNCDDSSDARKKRDVMNSLKVRNTTPSYGGKDQPSTEEIKHLIKYHNAAQKRCVTLHDYQARVMEIPAKYGCPFRCGVVEENNKIVIYLLGLDSEGHLKSTMAEQVAENIKNYLSNYKMINDLVEIRSGKIINLSFEVEIFVDKTYDKGDVVRRVIDLIYDYMDINKHQMGGDIFVGDIEKEISKLDGVQNLISMKVANETGDGYSNSMTTQSLVKYDDCGNIVEDYDDMTENKYIDLKESDKVLYTESNSMFEIKYKNRDIKVTVKQRQ